MLPTPRSTLPVWAAPCLALAAAALTALAYWPGLMTWDAVNQYGQAVAGRYNDWHPPAMAWVWRRLTALHAGPAPMLLLQLGLWWGGLLLWAEAARRRERPGLAVACLACGLLPLHLALLGAVLKDCLMAGALLAAGGCLALIQVRPSASLRIVGIGALLFAASLRFNAFLACMPLLVALLPAVWRSGRVRLAGAILAVTALLMLVLPTANRLIGTEPSGVGLSLAIFDLGGITARTGIDQFPSLGVADPVRVNHRCYTPVRWDSYSDWVDPECPLGFTAIRAAEDAGRTHTQRAWLAAILHHPLAYVAHRLAHFNINTRFLVHDRVERPVQVVSAPNNWGYRVTPGRLIELLDLMARVQAATPLGWPVAWMALAAAVLIVAPALPPRAPIVPLAWSSLLYGFGYGLFSVAAELRYHLWTEIAAALAGTLAAGELWRGARPGSPRLRAAVAVLAVVLLPAIAWRLFPVR